MNKIKKKKMLFNPFERYSEKTLGGIGGIGLLLAVFLSYFFNAHFDGALDVHFDHSMTYKEALIENAVSVICLVLIFFLVGRIVYHKTELIDVFVVCLIARIPLYLLAFSNFGNLQYELGQALFKTITERGRNIPMDAVILSTGMNILNLLVLIWVIVLLFNGFKIATNRKGIKLAIGFIVAILLAEILSKLLFYFIY